MVGRRAQLQLNRGESRQALARWLFFANQDELRTLGYEDVMNKPTCLSLLSNAVLVRNTVHAPALVAQLRAADKTILDAQLARISPLAYSHVIPSGTFPFRRVA